MGCGMQPHSSTSLFLSCPRWTSTSAVSSSAEQVCLQLCTCCFSFLYAHIHISTRPPSRNSMCMYVLIQQTFARISHFLWHHKDDMADLVLKFNFTVHTVSPPIAVFPVAPGPPALAPPCPSVLISIISTFPHPIPHAPPALWSTSL